MILDRGVTKLHVPTVLDTVDECPTPSAALVLSAFTTSSAHAQLRFLLELAHGHGDHRSTAEGGGVSYPL